MPLVGDVYKLPDHAKPFLGRSISPNGIWGGVPWGRSKRDKDLVLAGMEPGSMQVFKNDRQKTDAICFESDCDIDYDGPSPFYTYDELWSHESYISKKTGRLESAYQPHTSLKFKESWITKDKRITIDCDSRTFFGFVCPAHFITRFGLNLGDYGMCFHGGEVRAGQFFDIGPKPKLGEVSHAMAGAIKIPNHPRKGNDVNDLITLAFPGSGPGYAVSATEQWDAVIELFGIFTGRID